MWRGGEDMAEGLFFSQVCSGEGDSYLDVLFIHGLSGDPHDTWIAGTTQEYWPKWLCEDIEGLSAYTLGYPASVFGKWGDKEMNLHERADNVLEQLAAHGIGTRPIALICHSLGGILAKEMLRAANESSDDDWKQIARQTRLVVFMATPHKGASLASAIKLTVPRLASSHIDLLSNDDGYLTNLYHSYRDLASSAEIVTVSYYEKHRTKRIGIVVPADSADQV